MINVIRALVKFFAAIIFMPAYPVLVFMLAAICFVNEDDDYSILLELTGAYVRALTFNTCLKDKWELD